VITCIFLDIGGVLLTDGWNHLTRKRAAKKFKLKWAEMEKRHRLMFEVYENGHISLKEYLDQVVFYQKRPFTSKQFQNFMFSQSKSFPAMLELIRKLKEKYALKIIVVSNEGCELNLYRIKNFKLNEFVDSFISSCFVHIRKPNLEIFRLALDVAQVPISQIIYIENTQMFTILAEKLGIRSLLHANYSSTCKKLRALGLQVDEGDHLHARK
jgi:putative hydrolase of the HAD superfamily